MRREKKHLPNAENITIKKNKKTNITKFKLRTPKYLYTLKVDDTTKADKIMQSIPPNLKKNTIGGSKWAGCFWVPLSSEILNDLGGSGLGKTDACAMTGWVTGLLG